MAQQEINNGDSGLVSRNKINENDAELYTFLRKIASTSGNSLAEFGNSGVEEFLTVISNLIKVAQFGDGSTHSKIIVDPDGILGVNTGLWFSDGDTGLYESLSNRIKIRVGGTDVFQFLTDRFTTQSGSATLVAATATDVIPVILPSNSDSDTGIGRAAANELSLIAGGVEVIRVKPTGAYIKVIKSGATQAAAGANPDEVWKTSGHATLPDNVMIHGV